MVYPCPHIAAHNSNMETSNFNQLVDRGRAIVVCSSLVLLGLSIYHCCLVFILTVTAQYNDSLVFDGSWEKMAFVVREAIEKGM